MKGRWRGGGGGGGTKQNKGGTSEWIEKCFKILKFWNPSPIFSDKNGLGRSNTAYIFHA